MPGDVLLVLIVLVSIGLIYVARDAYASPPPVDGNQHWNLPNQLDN